MTKLPCGRDDVNFFPWMEWIFDFIFSPSPPSSNYYEHDGPIERECRGSRAERQGRREKMKMIFLRLFRYFFHVLVLSFHFQPQVKIDFRLIFSPLFYVCFTSGALTRIFIQHSTRIHRSESLTFSVAPFSSLNIFRTEKFDVKMSIFELKCEWEMFSVVVSWAPVKAVIKLW